jgi:hypothetical protein
MNPILKDLFKLTNLKAKVAVKPPKNCKSISIPRWDIFLNYHELLNPNSTCPYIAKLLESNELIRTIKEENFYPEFIRNVRSVRDWVISKLPINQSTSFVGRLVSLLCNPTHHSKQSATLTDSCLILERSAEPSFYSEKGNATIKTYGVTRRNLINTKAAATSIQVSNIEMLTYEPGKHSIYNQISTFNDCKAIIGIKGAEFANLAWMKPKTIAIMIVPEGMNTPPVQQALSKILEIEMIEIRALAGNYPDLLDFEQTIKQSLQNAIC